MSSASYSFSLRALEGRYGFFIGGIDSKRVEMPITASTPPVTLRYKRKGLRIEWILDPMFLMANSSIGRLGQRHRYIVYTRVLSADREGGGTVVVNASPLLLAPPKVFVDKTPGVHYMKEQLEEELGEDDDSDTLL
jgi:hypothetical protein